MGSLRRPDDSSQARYVLYETFKIVGQKLHLPRGSFYALIKEIMVKLYKKP